MRKPDVKTAANALLKPGHLIVAILFGAFLLSGCGGSDGTGREIAAPEPEVQGLLIPAGDAKVLTDALTSSFTTLASLSATPSVAEVFSGAVDLTVSPAPALGDGLADTRFTTTYTQESDVDEFDVVKYDGERLFIAPRQGFYQLAASTVSVAGGPLTTPPEQSRAIRILTTDPDNASATETARIELEANTTVQGMYLHNNRLVALTSESFYGGWGDVWLDSSVWQGQQNTITLYDVANNGSPQETWQASLDGSLIDSRRVGNTIYLFTRFSAYLQDLVDRPQTQEQLQNNTVILANAEADELLPKIRVNGEERHLVDPAGCLITNNNADAVGRNPSLPPDTLTSVAGGGSSVLTLITAIDINDPDNLQSICYNESAYGLYASGTAVYLSQLLYGDEPNSAQTRIHKFALAELSYVGSAEVPGLLWSGGQSDFRASEHNGDLRIFTTRWTGDAFDNQDHELSILRPATDRPELQRIASLPNDDQPEKIGKPNEALYGVRFFGDRAYAVTFEQIDPLYVIDLADPTQPRLAGELEVTGFSDFLHPVSSELLLGFGATADQALKLELFDVSDISAPRSLSVERLGGRFSYSEALYNRHAFTYLPNVTRGDVTVDRFAIPADLNADDQSFAWAESGLYLYEIANKDNPVAASINAAGAMVFDTPTATRSWPIGGRYRSVFDKDAVYLLRDTEVFSAFWNDPTAINGPLQ